MSSLVIQIPFAAGVLPGEFHTAEPSTGLLVVLAHGAGAGHQSPFLRRFAAHLATGGLDVLTFDFPYMAAGRKLPDRPPALEEAVRAAVDAGVDRLAGRARAVVVAGKSMGGRMATHVAAQPERWTSPVPLVAAVAFGYPLRPPGPRGGDRVSHLARLAVPTLVVQGTRDTFGGPDDVRAAAAAAPRVEVLAIETGDHSLKVTRASGQSQDAVETGIAAAVTAFVRQAADRAVP